MIDWKVEDLSPSRNKGILRHILEQGAEGSDNPADGALVTGKLLFYFKLIPCKFVHYYPDFLSDKYNQNLN